ALDALDAFDRAGDGHVRAGLAVVQDERHHLTVHVVPGGGAPGRSAGEDATPHVRVALREAGEEAVLAVVPLGAVVPGTVTLEVAADGLTYEVALRPDEVGAPNAPAAALRRVLARVPHRALSGETAQSFAGAVLALVAEGLATGPAVTFRGVRYER
ncbi:MAG TPA: hypothetical protein DHV14_02105, partial [Micrococcales bacterium]|nr:hypothetical protein [Micrococcales bacterium]